MALWARGVVALAAAKVAIALLAGAVGLATGTLAPTRLPPWVTAALVLAYGCVGLTLVVAGRSDRRAREFGAFLLLIAAAFSDVLARTGHPLGGVSALVASLRVEAFLPFFLWAFVRDFPVPIPMGRTHAIAEHAATASLVGGVLLCGVNLAIDLGAIGMASPVRLFSRHLSGGLYWPLLFVMMIPAGAVLVQRASLQSADGRRLTFFVSSVLVGLLPISVDIVARLVSPWWASFVRQPGPAFIEAAVVVFSLLSVPFTTAYAVLVDLVVDVRLLVRAALQYALARYTVLALVSLPFLWVAVFVYANRGATVQQLLTGPVAAALLVGLIAAAVALALRKATLRAIDRRFFREQYDAQQILSGLVEASRRVDSTERLADLLEAEVNRALHVDRACVLVLDDASACFAVREGTAPPLPAATMLVRLLSGSDHPLDVDLDARSALHRIPVDERAWLSDSGFALLVPLRGAAGELIGVLGVGEKLSGLPYTTQDRRLLAAVGASGGLCLENRRTRDASPRTVTLTSLAATAPITPAAIDEPARECRSCGLVHARHRTTCGCGATLVEALLPEVLAGKFRIDRRIGAGGMGVVYRAEDLTLGRSVAIKVLPRVSPEHTWRLRREARAMALVTHPNLALIYGAESWLGRPALVVEYLSGGTLTRRLKGGPMPVDEVLALGTTLADVLQTLHGAGLLHRDIKPSNIGFTVAGTPKLLDFGLARLVGGELDTAARTAPAAPASTDATGIVDGSSANRSVVGTPPYMSPEAVRNDTPGPSFDLWSLSVVLFEAASGVNPFKGATLLATLAQIQAGVPPDLHAHLSTCPADLALFFRRTLAGDRRARPATALEYGQLLAALRGSLLSI